MIGAARIDDARNMASIKAREQATAELLCDATNYRAAYLDVREHVVELLGKRAA